MLTARNELKRKLSTIDTSEDVNNDECLHLKIEEVELEQNEQEVNKVQLIMEKAEMDTRLYHSRRQEAEKRIISLGNALWKLKRSLSDAEEKAGKITILTPDSDDAFTAALFHLYKNPRPVGRGQE